MANEIVPVQQGNSGALAPSPMAAVGQVANGAAAKHAIGDYLGRKADNTIRAQAAGLQLFADYLEDVAGGLGGPMRRYADDVASWQGQGDGGGQAPDPDAWRGVTWGIVAAFVKWQVGEGYAIGSVNQRLSAVKVHARLAAKAGAIGREELAMIKDVSGYAGKEAKRIDERRDVTRVGDKKAEHTSLTVQEAERLKGMYTHEGPQGARDRLLMCMLLDHGLRVSEVAGLQVSNFDLAAGELRFYRPKVDKWQTHKLTDDSMKAAKGYIVNHAPPIGRLILGSVKGGELNGRPMSKRAITKRVNYLGRRMLDIDNLSAHDCRHFWATYWSKRLDRLPRGILQLQEAGGWNSMAMPRRYAEEAAIANEGMA